MSSVGQKKYKGFLCVSAPLILALTGKGKIHCSHYCPRGSFFGKFLSLISLREPLPSFMTTKIFKNSFLILMMIVFGYCLYLMGWGYNNIAQGVLRMMIISFALGITIGIMYMPRSWCKICPMGHAAGLIRDVKNNKR